MSSGITSVTPGIKSTTTATTSSIGNIGAIIVPEIDSRLKVSSRANRAKRALNFVEAGSYTYIIHLYICMYVLYITNVIY